MSCIDILSGNVFCCEYVEIYKQCVTIYNKLDRFITIHNPKYILLLHKNIDISNLTWIDSKKMKTINLSNKNNSTEYILSTKVEKQNIQEEILKEFYTINDITIFYDVHNFYMNNYAAQSLCFLLNYIKLEKPNLIKNLKEPINYKVDNSLTIANHGLVQLNILNNNQHSGKYSSVEKLLNCCKTNMGKRFFKYMITNPITNEQQLQDKYDLIKYVSTIYNVNEIRSILGNINDIEFFFRNIIVGKVKIKDIYKFLSDINNIIKLNTIFNNDDKLSFNSDYVKELDKLFNDLFKPIYTENSYIKYGYHTELDEKNDELYKYDNELNCIINYLNSVLSKNEKKGKTSMLFNLVNTKNNGLVIQTTENRGKKLCAMLKNIKNKKIMLCYDDNKFILDISKIQNKKNTSSKKVFITSPYISRICSKLEDLKTQVDDITNDIFQQFSQSLKLYNKQFASIIENCINIDIAFNNSFLYHKYDLCIPQIDSSDVEPFINCKGIRHCLIENIQTEIPYTTNDIEMNQEGWLVYGTNAVGKTSLIKSIGINIILAQCGMPVFSQSLTYKPFTAIYTRILGNDNLFKGLSTFGVEMSELRNIINNADSKSLILGDELCSGTETSSALSIIITSLLEFEKKQCSYVFATHFHEIPDIEVVDNISNIKIKHMSITYDNSTGDLIYDRKLKEGRGSQMYGIEVCRSIGFSDAFMETALNIRKNYITKNKSLNILNSSSYNSKKINKGICELEGCTNPCVDVHHMRYQKDANENGYINGMHMNHKSNLINICKKHHDDIHKNNIRLVRKKTTRGTKIFKI